jgi:hypothetical protein
MGMPGKPDRIDGAEVERYFLKGKIREIAGLLDLVASSVDEMRLASYSAGLRISPALEACRRGEKFGPALSNCLMISHSAGDASERSLWGTTIPCNCARRSSHRSLNTLQWYSSYVPRKMTGQISIRGKSLFTLPALVAWSNSFDQ